MRETVGVIFLLIGIIGITFSIVKEIYSVFGWKGVTTILYVVIFFSGIVLLGSGR